MENTHILLIDDDIDDQEFFTEALEALSLEISCTVLSNAIDALEKLMSKALHPDVIFLDLNMPKMNGENFLIQVKHSEQLKNIPVVICSTCFDPQTKLKMKDLGAHDYIVKPISLESMVQRLTDVFLHLPVLSGQKEM